MFVESDGIIYFYNQRGPILMKLYLYLISILVLFCSFNVNTFAKTYYVDFSKGSDSSNGLSGDNEGGGIGPWQTASKVNNSTFSTGDDIYFKCGETWNLASEGLNDLTIKHDGTSSDHVIIGAYYMDGITERFVDGSTYMCSGQLPTFDGNHTKPETFDEGLINNARGSDCGNNIDFQDLRVIKSNQEGFAFRGSSSESCSNVNGYRLKTYQNMDSGYAVWGDISYVTIEESESNWDVYERYQSGGSSGAASAIYFIRSDGSGGKPSNIKFQKNTIVNNYGECININHPIDLLIQNNLFYNNMKNDCINIWGHFSNEGTITIRRNLFYQTDAARNWKEPQNGDVLSINDCDVYAGEKPLRDNTYEGLMEIYFYDNFVAGYEKGINFANDSCFLKNYPSKIQQHDKIYIYNNTFVDTEEYVIDCAAPVSTIDYGNNIYIVKNIFAKYDINDSNCTGSATPYDCCTGWKTGNCDEMWEAPACDNDPDFDNVNFDYNNYSKMPSSEDIKGSNDYYGDPLLVKKSGWMSLTDGSLNGSEFALGDGSPIKNTNEPIGAQFHFKYSNALSSPRNLTVKNKK